MAGSVEEEINALVDALDRSEYSKEESNLILKQYINAVIRNGVQDVMRYPVAMTTADYTKRVKNHEWKFARGFFGNWAKHAIEERDQDVGC
jgi:hypothetical protein